MTSKTCIPCLPLQQYIDSYTFVDVDWTTVDNKADTWRLIPSGLSYILLVYGDKHVYSIDGPNTGFRETLPAFAVGQQTQPIWLKFSGRTRLLKILFRPQGLSYLLPVEMHEIANQLPLNLSDVWGSAVSDFLDAIASSPDQKRAVEYIDNFFTRKLLQASGGEYIDYTLSRLMAENGNSPIKSIHQKLGITCRHLERLFRARVGLSPKEYGRIVRLNYALSRIQESPAPSLTRISYESGYFDQAHFSRDFKNITGSTPLRLLVRNYDELLVTRGKCFFS